MSDPLEPTFGEKAVGSQFNPSGSDKVTRLKAAYAVIINILHEDRSDHRDERSRLASIAITETQGAQMWAVKAVTFERDEEA
ncbi:DUF7681 family protein [Hoyosella altamirensis]|uniref:Acb2/Tad1 hairpin domain-containing protein n=1 Tax=Hoyosella altamirensis TaxID=616997 RepID=A0A839RUY6_9ACTN|nr:hypothetical protein [Hoyosella altamirensis]MBB3040159.1 hypothetical protein [Hoyosella altamirensis]